MPVPSVMVLEHRMALLRMGFMSRKLCSRFNCTWGNPASIESKLGMVRWNSLPFLGNLEWWGEFTCI